MNKFSFIFIVIFYCLYLVQSLEDDIDLLDQNDLLEQNEQNYTLSNFMSHPKYLNKTFVNATLIGTHDSGAYKMQQQYIKFSKFFQYFTKFASMMNIPVQRTIEQWAKAQDIPIYEQLQEGVRYLDFRVAWFEDEWYLFHGFVIADKLQDSLNEIHKFLLENPSESIVIELQHIYPNKEEYIKKLLEQIELCFSGLIFTNDLNFKEWTFEKMATESKRILIVFQEDIKYIKGNKNFWSNDTILNTYAQTSHINQMQEFNEYQIKEFKTHCYLNQFYKISYTLTPQKITLKKFLYTGKPRALIELADTANKQFQTWHSNYLQNTNYTQPIFGNILIFDHIQTANITDFIFNQ